MSSEYIIKCSKGFIEYVEHYDGTREYGFTFDKKYAKKYKGEVNSNRALREFKKITGLEAVKIEVENENR